MVAAVKTAPGRVTTEERRQATKARVPVSRRRRKMRNVAIVRTVASVLGLLFLLGYIGLYAQVTLYGYRRDDLSKQARRTEMENQALRAEIQTLASPDRLAAVAASAGMLPGSQVVYVRVPGQVEVAKAD